jgi:hypothetical protein
MEEEKSGTERCKFVSLKEGRRIKELYGGLDGAVKEDVSMTPMAKQMIQMFRPVPPIIFVAIERFSQ